MVSEKSAQNSLHSVQVQTFFLSIMMWLSISLDVAVTAEGEGGWRFRDEDDVLVVRISIATCFGGNNFFY